MVREYLIGVDIGTTTSKGMMITPRGETIAACSFEHGIDRPYPGWAEHDADKVWWGDFVKVCHTLLQKSSVDTNLIRAVGCSALSPVVLPVDSSGHPLRPGILYAIDTRAVEEIEILKKSIGDEYSIKVSANRFSSQSILPKILWLKRREPEVFKKSSGFLNASSYIVFRLTNNYVADHGSASIGGLPYDINSMTWDVDACREIGIKTGNLPELSLGHSIAGHVTKSAAVETGLPEGIPVAVGTTDHLSEMLSLGAVKNGRAVLSYGTTFCLDVCTPGYTYFPGLLIARTGYTKDGFIAGGALASGAGITKWFRDNFGRDEMEMERSIGTDAYELLSSAAATIRPGSDGLILLPYFNGERCPVFDPKARGMLFGLTLQHKKDHIYRAILEGVAYGVRHLLNTLKKAGIPVEQVTMVGGATMSDVWTQIISDVTQLEQRRLEHSFGAENGAACLAGLAAEAIDFSCIEDLWDKPGTVVKPNPEDIGIYDKYYKIYRNLYEKTAEEMHLL
jgi:xylulokinase